MDDGRGRGAVDDVGVSLATNCATAMTMVYSYNYDSDYHPSMPMIELSLGLPLSETAIEVRAIVDSGADSTKRFLVVCSNSLSKLRIGVQ